MAGTKEKQLSLLEKAAVKVPFIKVLALVLTEGKKFKRKAWPKYKCIEAKNGRLMVNERGRYAFISDNEGDMSAKDWEEVLPAKRAHLDSKKNYIKTVEN